jgi:cystathionine beta-lyase/cystathionine gamma-synthase
MIKFLKNVLEKMPTSWLSTTTHRLDIYNEKLAKTEFLEQFELLSKNNSPDTLDLRNLPTAYDYIRLGHPLSCVLEWSIAHLHDVNSKNIISFSSQSIPILAILRKNLLAHKNTQIIYTDNFLDFFDYETINNTYGYNFELKKVKNLSDIPAFEGSTVLVSQSEKIDINNLGLNVDFFINTYKKLGSILIINGKQNEQYISEIQHVRRRETIAMTPANCHTVLLALIKNSNFTNSLSKIELNKKIVRDEIINITGALTMPLIGSSGLSIQYAIMMGLVDFAQENHEGKPIKFIVPPNCYGGTNDQARRVAACIKNVEVIDLPVDGENDMTQSIDLILDEIAIQNAVPFIIAEIPTNPRVEVPDLIQLKTILEKKRQTTSGELAINPVFVLDQTFCPNTPFLDGVEIFSKVSAISYVSGSKFPSGGLCTAGYCVGNEKTISLMCKIDKHLSICDNEATDLQYEILAKQLPSMNQRIIDAYENTQDFVNFITKNLPGAKINFVSKELVHQGFTPSVFSLDLPTKGNTAKEKENYKRALNLKLINLMIKKIPNESKFCVSYGQLKGSYWTIPATSTQGTTKEGDKDYIVRVSLSPKINLTLHKKVFLEFTANI